MTHNHQPIGLFDSGVGGLTVLREFDHALPQESVLYFGDTARLPYGTRTAAEIIDFVRDILDWMADRGVKMALMACNTSSALALDAVRAEYDFPILGLIFPGARAAVKAGQRIGVIATPATANSGAYGDAMREIDPHVKVWEVGCPQFVPIVEGDRLDDPDTIAIARQYLEPLCEHQIDTLVYGCTHYPHLAEIIRPLVGDRVTLIDPAAHLVASARRELDLLGLRATDSGQPTQFYVSGAPSQFAELSSRWLGFRPRVQRVIFPSMIEAPTDRLLVNAEE